LNFYNIKLLKADGRILILHQEKINEIFAWFRNVIHKEAFNYIGFCFRNLLSSLTTINPNNLCSVSYNIIFDDPNDFFSKHLPIRVRIEIILYFEKIKII
jgi:hypothetical protein